MEAPVDSDNEEGSDESLLLAEEYDDEVDINIHFHCEHCVKMGRCQERPKLGWACEIDYCPNGCGHRSLEVWFVLLCTFLCVCEETTTLLYTHFSKNLTE